MVQADKKYLKKKIEEKQVRLKAYKDRELLMLSPDGIQSYGIGSRNAARYSTDLKAIQDMISKLELEVDDLQRRLDGKSPRRALGVVPRDW